MTPPDLDGELDLDDRQLCPDDNCIGLLGADGRCKVCGRPGTATSTNGAKITIVEPSEPLATAEADADAGDAQSDLQADGTSDTAWDDRALCGDDTCIGVLDASGVCKTCGKRASA